MRRVLLVFVALFLLALPVAPALSQSDSAEVTFWQSVRESKVPDELEAYLKAYPNGKFAPLAVIRLKALQEIGEAQRKEKAAPTSPSAAKTSDPQTASTPPVHDCDRLAANPNDPMRMSDGVEWDQIQVQEAVRTCQRALEAHPGTARFEYQLGRAFQRKASYSEALTHFRSAADKAYAAAIFNLGAAYENGHGVTKDEAEAVRWFRKAAETGDPWGMQNLAVFVAKGIGITKDVTEANRWHRKAAEAGNMNAMTNLGVNLESGFGITKDVAEANHWYRKGAEAGHRDAMTYLANNLESGNGITKDQANAVEWYQKAAEKGEPYAFKRLHALNTGVAEENSISGDPPDNASVARMSREELERSFRIAALEANWQRAIPFAKELDARKESRLHRTGTLLLGLDKFKSGSYTKAKRDFKAASLGPIGELTSTLALAWTEVAQGNTKKALKLLNTSKQAEWKQSFLNYHRALIVDLDGRQKEADAAFKLGYKNENRTLRTALAYARHVAHYGGTKRAKDILQERIERVHDVPPPITRDLLAKIEAGEKISLLVKTPEDGMAEVFYGLGAALVGEGGVMLGILYLQMARYLQPHHAFARATLAVAKPESSLDSIAKDLEKLD